MGQKRLSETRVVWQGTENQGVDEETDVGNGREFSPLASPGQPVRIKTEKKKCEDQGNGKKQTA